MPRCQSECLLPYSLVSKGGPVERAERISGSGPLTTDRSNMHKWPSRDAPDRSIGFARRSWVVGCVQPTNRTIRVFSGQAVAPSGLQKRECSCDSFSTQGLRPGLRSSAPLGLPREKAFTLRHQPRAYAQGYVHPPRWGFQERRPSRSAINPGLRSSAPMGLPREKAFTLRHQPRACAQGYVPPPRWGDPYRIGVRL